MDMKIEFSESDQIPIVPQNSIGKWSLKSDTSVLITDLQQSGSHRKIIRVSLNDYFLIIAAFKQLISKV